MERFEQTPNSLTPHIGQLLEIVDDLIQKLESGFRLASETISISWARSEDIPNIIMRVKEALVNASFSIHELAQKALTFFSIVLINGDTEPQFTSEEREKLEQMVSQLTDAFIKFSDICVKILQQPEYEQAIINPIDFEDLNDYRNDPDPPNNPVAELLIRANLAANWAMQQANVLSKLLEAPQQE